MVGTEPQRPVDVRAVVRAQRVVRSGAERVKPLLVATHLDVPARRAANFARRLRRPHMAQPPYAPAVHRLVRRSIDPVRAGTLALAGARVDREQVPGAVAEVGVYRGETSALLRRAMPFRRLYLFDTFEGFAPEDLEGYSDTRWRDTSEAVVRRRVGDTTNVEIRKGRFPETVVGLEDERFALVVADVDLYLPTMAALEFFYERLSPGGFIFVHDYNCAGYEWRVARAVDEFLSDKPEGLVELPDLYGSVVVRTARPARRADEPSELQPVVYSSATDSTSS